MKNRLERQIVFREEIIERKQPENLGKQEVFLFEKAFTEKLPEVNVLRISNANILKGIIFCRQNLRFYTSLTNLFPVTIGRKLKALLSFLKSPKVHTAALWITDEWSSEYFHWLTDALPRLIAAQKLDTINDVLLPESYKNKSYISESLTLLGCNPVYFRKENRIVLKKLLVAEHTARTGNFRPELMKELRRNFNTQSTELPYRKIYISRKKAAKRTISNEELVQKAVESLGFETHYFEDYDFYKQCKLLQQTSMLIGLHGAGLTNMIFMPAGGKVIEIRNNGDAQNNCFYALATALENPYYYLLADGNTSNTYETIVTVNIEKLRELIEQVNESRTTYHSSLISKNDWKNN